jgi:hypothetical protein
MRQMVVINSLFVGVWGYAEVASMLVKLLIEKINATLLIDGTKTCRTR